ncbi:ubiquinone/menaquinone biosynthesis methyltransferase UbiE [Coprinopsis sp. MPI-PUGE-AT-0042]|nr:ubiquinone/menaquinone biosynthesis methyltransferase UbiE [Coprinopsis sp. MPI-PUGE-AT-0042]
MLSSTFRSRFCSQAARASRCSARLNSTQATPSSSSAGPSQPRTTAEPKTVSFGFRTVPEDAKESLVKEVFNSVASKYDLMNDATSFGIHRLWKDSFVSGAASRSERTAEKYADRETTVDIVDINAEMLKEGYIRLKKTMYHNTPQVAFHEGNAQQMSQFPDNSYDLYTIAFGIRNCTSIPDVLKEAHRILKPGGTFACLEFSRVNNPLLSAAYDQYSFNVIPLMGTILAGDSHSYQYLVESIRKFPPQPEFAQMIRDAGFSTGRDEDGGAWTDLWGGIASIHKAVKV